MNLQEEVIKKKLIAGDESGLRQLFDMYYTPLCVYALKFIDSFDKVEDIVQDVFINFWESGKATEITSTIKNYLFRAVKNNSLNHLRNTNRYRLEPIDEQFELEEENYDDNSELEQKKKQLYTEIDKLSPQAKLVFESIVFSNMKYKEVAEELGVSVNTVKTTFSRALKRLRSSLDVIILLMLP